ncbi:hypothetical protein BH11ACT2_BH11ACT2_16870 [soil metagenome]
MAYPEVVTRPTPVLSALPAPRLLAPSRLLGRRALVTSTDSALGAAVADAFIREGASVVSIGGSLADEDAATTLVDDAAERLGGLDLVVVIPAPASVELASSPLDQVLRQNIYPLFWLSKAANRHLRAGSSIITTDLVDGTGRRASIAEAKAGIETVTSSLAHSLAAHGVRVNGVAPREHGADAAHVAAAYLDAATGDMTGQMLVV